MSEEKRLHAHMDVNELFDAYSNKVLHRMMRMLGKPE